MVKFVVVLAVAVAAYFGLVGYLAPYAPTLDGDPVRAAAELRLGAAVVAAALLVLLLWAFKAPKVKAPKVREYQ